MVATGAGLTAKGLPLPTGVPAQLPLYHSKVAPPPEDPPLDVSDISSPVAAPGQKLSSSDEAPVGAVANSLTETVVEAQLVVLQSPS